MAFKQEPDRVRVPRQEMKTPGRAATLERDRAEL
ncbi:MAG: hypothetical protein JWQ44_291 [Chthoniobacter sp.]|jgi:hypothetical protein|nr:hypothetical protein [Chthoniobacter sp.]